MCCKQRTCTIIQPYRYNTYEKLGGGGPNFDLVRSRRTANRTQFSGKKAMLTGEGISTTSPVAVNPPVTGSILKTTMLFDSWFSASRYLPLGSIAKCRGSFPPVGTCATKVRVPFAGSMAKIAMLSCPRLEVYRNFPLGCVVTSAASFRPVKPFGNVEVCCTLR